MKLIECKVLMEGRLVKSCIDFNKIIAVIDGKYAAGANEGIKSIITIGMHSFATDIPYDIAVKAWEAPSI